MGGSAGGAAISSRLFYVPLCLAVALVFPLSKAAAQSLASAETKESQVQLVQPSGPGQATPPITITLQDALERARKLDPQFLGALSDAKSAKEDRLQARNAMLPRRLRQRRNTLGHRGTAD